MAKKQRALPGVKPGRGSIWIEVKVIKGQTFVYERRREYQPDGSFILRSKYIGKGKRA
jgi:hypothetical protein